VFKICGISTLRLYTPANAGVIGGRGQVDETDEMRSREKVHEDEHGEGDGREDE
jgi:hypothetical protein